jgi:transcriptional regulator with XRE-family HTH domain
MSLNAMGQIIKRARGKMTQEELAFQCDVSQGWITKIELGQIENPSAEKLRRVARVLHMDARVLFAAQFDIPYGDPAAADQALTVPPDDPLLLAEEIARLTDRLVRLTGAAQSQSPARRSRTMAEA